MKLRNVIVPLFILLLLSTPAFAGELAGIKMPEQISVGGKALELSGMGLRKKLFFKVYVAGLYLQNPTSDAGTVVSSDQIKQVNMVMMRDLGRSKITEAVEAGFEKNNAAQMPKLRQRLDKFNAGILDLEEGDHLTITYLPGTGTVLEGKGNERLVIEGKDFGDALFSVWFGQHPVDENLKSEMLGS